MHVSQILISDDTTAGLSPFLTLATNSVRSAFPGANYQLYSGDMLRQFIATNFDSEVVSSYDRLLPYSYKADLGRYCLLHALGGWYFDVSIRVALRMGDVGSIETVVFRDKQRFGHSTFACSTGVIFSRKGNPIFEEAIRLVVLHCKTGYYGATPLCPTGPNVFGRALAKFGASATMLIGDLMDLTPQLQTKNTAFVLPDGQIFAYLKPNRPGDLTELGAARTNNYLDLYKERRIYAGSAFGP